MLKRADSVSKRWSQASGAGLARSGSTASNRNSYMGGYGGSVPITDRATSNLSSSRDNSLEPSSRPTSSHSNLTVTQRPDDKTAVKDDDGFVKPSLPSRAHSRSKSVASLRSLSNEQSGAEPASPASPSKRWSPTKSSWLESALIKEDKPKVTTQAPPAQPSWMVEINKAKQQRAASPTKEISSPFGADVKSSPFGRDKLKSVAEPVSSPAPTPAKKAELAPVERAVSPPQEALKAKSPPPEVAAKPAVTPKEKPNIPAKLSSPPSQPTSSITALRKNQFENAAAASPPPSNTPGKFDFRSQLKSRAPPQDSSKSNEPEFKNALGNLKRAKTQNYVAPDTLKDNITRGKAGLNITGGVPERKRVDELKEQLNAQKAAIQARKESGELPVRPQKPKEMEALPEGLARRKTLTRSDSDKAREGLPMQAKSAREETPEAVAALRGLVNKEAKPPVGAKPMSPPAKEKSPPPVAEKRVSQEPAKERSSIGMRLKDDLDVPKPAATPSTNSTELTKTKSAPVQPFGLPGMAKPGVSNKLADRFNPALANMLARGPPGSGSTSKNASPGDSPALSRTTTQDEVKPGPELEHKTKGRARGPKRRAKGKADEPSNTSAVEHESKPESSSTLSSTPTLSASKPPVATPVRHGRIPSVQLVKQKDVLSSSPAAKIEEPVNKPALPKPMTPSRHGRIPSGQLVRPEHVLKSSPDPTLSKRDVRPESVASKSRSKPTTPSKSSSLSSTSNADADSKLQSTPARLPLREQVPRFWQQDCLRAHPFVSRAAHLVSVHALQV